MCWVCKKWVDGVAMVMATVDTLLVAVFLINKVNKLVVGVQKVGRY